MRQLYGIPGLRSDDRSGLAKEIFGAIEKPLMQGAVILADEGGEAEHGFDGFEGGHAVAGAVEFYAEEVEGAFLRGIMELACAACPRRRPKARKASQGRE